MALAAIGATLGALLERRFSRPKKNVIVAATGLSAALAIDATRHPSKPAKALLGQPTLSLAVGALPVVAAPAFGRRFNALHMLSITGTGVAAAVEGGERHREVALLASVYWVVQSVGAKASLKDLARDEKLVMNLAVVPLSFWAVARITPDILKAARELGMLNDKLTQAEDQVAGLATYRNRLERAVDRARSALVAADAALDRRERSDRRRVLDTLLRSVGRLDERAAVLEVASNQVSGVEALLRGRISAFEELQAYLPPPEIGLSVEPRLGVTDARVLALIGGAATTSLSNAMRHAQSTEIRVLATSRGSDRVCLRVENTGQGAHGTPDSSRPVGSGLGHLRWQAEALDGFFDWGPDGDGGWFAELILPTSVEVDLGEGLTAERMVDLVDVALVTSTRITAAMVGGMALEGRQFPPDAHRRSIVLAAAVCLGYEILDAYGLIGRDPATTSGAARHAETAFLAAAAVASAFSPHYEHSLWSGWANSALSRYGLRADRRSLGGLTLAHVAAIAVSFRGRPRDALVMASHQMTIPLLGPLAIYLATSRALSVLDANERALQESLVEISQMHDLAESFHISHPATTPLEHLRQQLIDEPEVANGLAEAKDLLTDAARALPSGLNVSDFADQFAQVVATRLWPAEVTLERDDDRLAELDAEAAMTVDFRRPALVVADRLGDRIAASFPPDWLARPRLHGLRLRISANHETDCIQIQAIPCGPVNQAAAEEDALAASLARAGGTISEGFADGRILINLRFERYRAAALAS